MQQHLTKRYGYSHAGETSNVEHESLVFRTSNRWCQTTPVSDARGSLPLPSPQTYYFDDYYGGGRRDFGKLSRQCANANAIANTNANAHVNANANAKASPACIHGHAFSCQKNAKVHPPPLLKKKKMQYEVPVQDK